jgi:hypothetical protein
LVIGVEEVGMDEMAMAPRPRVLDAVSCLDDRVHDGMSSARLVWGVGAR